ncbi:hypothetical protein [Rhodococcus sp. (in: high G+C Gram-positive bacteria)]|uniref:hypothetical protein n=1 Tax=Rhodococcus sp. TaxID=1831 RepID=UPI0032606BB7
MNALEGQAITRNRLRRTVKPGDQVRIGAGGVSVFTIISIDEDTQTAIIESTADAPGKYPFPTKTVNLMPASQDPTA